MNWNQRSSNSAPGRGPVKPPMSWPTSGIPDRLMDRLCARFQRKVCQLVKLSPLQVSATAPIPSGPAREMQ